MEPTEKSSPAWRIVQALLDGEADFKPLMPTNSKVFAQSLLGRDKPITEGDFTDEELQVIAELAAAADNSAVTYASYDAVSPAGWEASPDGTVLGGLQEKLAGNTAPAQSVMTTLGQFQAVPEGDGYRIRDTYNFNSNYPTREEAQADFWERLKGFRPWRLDDEFSDPYSIARAAGEAYGPRGMRAFGGGDGEGIPVDLYVPRR